MNSQYPDKVVEKFLQLSLAETSFVYLAIDEQGKLLDKGGNESSIRIPNWTIGENLLESIMFLSSYLPMASDHEYIPSYQVSEDCVLDVHLFREPHCIWIMMFDKTADIQWEARARQTGNELKLLQQKMRNLDKGGKRELFFHTDFDFFESLNMMAMQSKEDGSFELLQPVSERFISVYPECFDSTMPLFPQHKFEFVDNFMIDATELWSDPCNPKRVRSGPWIEVAEGGEEMALEAIALNWNGHRLLFIEVLDEIYELNHNFLQVGREGVLLSAILEEEVRKKTHEIRLREEEIALRLVSAADSRDDGETGSHIRRLGLYSELIARHLGWSKDDAEEIRIAAPMHDIGKIGIPDYILKKPGKLTAKEFEIMKLHPQIGARILSNSDSPLVIMARDICLSHHEKWDGSGYPGALTGEDIPISGRIVAIVDVFDALIHKRVYKDEMPVDRAIELMLKGRGSHFDPALLDLFVSLQEQMSEIAFDYRNPIGDEFSGAHGFIEQIQKVPDGNS